MNRHWMNWDFQTQDATKLVSKLTYIHIFL